MNIDERIRAAINHLQAAWGDASAGLANSASCEMARAREIVVALDTHLAALAAASAGNPPPPIAPVKIGCDMIVVDPSILLAGQIVPAGGTCIITERVLPLPCTPRQDSARP